jgi:hypothetical protein
MAAMISVWDVVDGTEQRVDVGDHLATRTKEREMLARMRR